MSAFFFFKMKLASRNEIDEQRNLYHFLAFLDIGNP